MANYKKIAETYPAVVPYLRARIWQRSGDLLTYRAENNTKVFSTDSLGFRHSIFDGQTVPVNRTIVDASISVVLGSSHTFGFGLPGNESTFASRFAEKFGHAVLNISLPEANTRDLYNCLRKYVPVENLKNVVFFPGGSFTRFCYTGLCSPIDGPPPLHSMSDQQETRARGAVPDTPNMFDNLLHYQKKYTLELARLCSDNGVNFWIVDEETFFEKQSPSDVEKNGELGIAPQPQGTERFDRHRKYIAEYRAQLFDLLRKEDVKVLDFGSVEEINFIDEFHYDAASVQVIVDRLFDQMSD